MEQANQVNEDDELLKSRWLKRIQHSAYIWNTAACTIYAFQSVVILMVLTRICGLEIAGIFTIAYANANLFLNIGKFGVRNFQSSDVLPVFSFITYVRARIVSCFAMLISGLACLAYSALTIGYPVEKTTIIALVLVFKLIDAIEDVIYGNYQQHLRLDIGAKFMTLRVGSTLLVLCACVIYGLNLSLALIVSIIYGFAFLFGGVLFVRYRFGLPVADNGLMTKRAQKETHSAPRKASNNSISRLLIECLPIFLASFLLFYLGNAPKYAIDTVLNDVAQAQYGFVAMPGFVVEMFATFIYSPLITPLSRNWKNGKRKVFACEFIRQIGYIFLIVLLCDLAAWLFGIPILNLLYGTELGALRAELIILVSAGAFLALANLFNMGITVIRRQKQLVWGYGAVALAAFLAAKPIVVVWGITGAALLYLVCMMVLALWFGVVFFWYALKGEGSV